MLIEIQVFMNSKISLVPIRGQAEVHVSLHILLAFTSSGLVTRQIQQEFRALFPIYKNFLYIFSLPFSFFKFLFPSFPSPLSLLCSPSHLNMFFQLSDIYPPVLASIFISLIHFIFSLVNGELYRSRLGKLAFKMPSFIFILAQVSLLNKDSSDNSTFYHSCASFEIHAHLSCFTFLHNMYDFGYY